MLFIFLQKYYKYNQIKIKKKKFKKIFNNYEFSFYEKIVSIDILIDILFKIEICLIQKKNILEQITKFTLNFLPILYSKHENLNITKLHNELNKTKTDYLIFSITLYLKYLLQKYNNSKDIIHINTLLFIINNKYKNLDIL